MQGWGILLRDHHEGYISWEQFEENQRLILENAHMQKRASRKSARGGRALLTGLVRCGRCGRMMRVFYGMRSGHAHRYQCRGDDAHVGAGSASASAVCGSTVQLPRRSWKPCRTVPSKRRFLPPIKLPRLLPTSGRRWTRVRGSALRSVSGGAALRSGGPARRKRHVARELEARWNAALERVAQLERRIADLEADAASRPKIDRAALMQLAHDLPAGLERADDRCPDENNG
jgi:hypothetical protein